MADENPLLKAYPKAPPSCSTRQYCIAGLQTTIYGLDELLSTTKSAGVACIWLLHGRMGKQDMMQPVAASVLHAWNQYQMAQPDRQDYVGLVAVTFDQRNHGSREIDAKRNQDWRSGNMTHAIDMFSIYRPSICSAIHVTKLITGRGNNIRSISNDGLYPALSVYGNQPPNRLPSCLRNQSRWPCRMAKHPTGESSKGRYQHHRLP